MCISGGTATEDVVSIEFPNANLVRAATDLDPFIGIQNGICNGAITTVGTWLAYRYDSSANGDCNLDWVGRIIKVSLFSGRTLRTIALVYSHPLARQPVESGFALKADSGILCTSLLRDVMDLYLLEMTSDGFVDAAWSQYGEKYGTVVCDETGDNVMQTKQMTMLNMGGIFLFHGILTTCSLLMAIAVWCRSGGKTDTPKNKDISGVVRIERTPASAEAVPLMVPGGVDRRAVESLRIEMNMRFEKVVALLDTKDKFGDKVDL
jgi:hypothetical protein